MSAKDAKHILALNAGSGSLKLGLYDWEARQELAADALDWTQKDNASGVSNHAQALQHLLEKLKLDPHSIGAIGHRVVHGGSEYAESVRIDDKVKAAIERYAEIDPLHNEAALSLIEAAQKIWSDVPEVAAFDTAFHHTLAPFRYLYPVPYDWYEKWGIRRFGFHGLSFAYSTRRAAEMLGKPIEALRLVICHLGSGASLAAVEGGRSVATTMGFTPLEGLMMATRSGSVDPGLLLYLLSQQYQTVTDLDKNLNHAAGLKGISGISGDMRDILAARAEGNERAELAYLMYVDHVRQGVGAMIAALGGLDALVFTDGVAEHVAQVRAEVARSFEWMGLELDEAANLAVSPDTASKIITDTDIARPDSKVRVLVIRAREELMVARETHQVLVKSGSG